MRLDQPHPCMLGFSLMLLAMSRSLEFAQFTLLFTGCLGILLSRHSSEQLEHICTSFYNRQLEQSVSPLPHIFFSTGRIKHLFHTGMFHAAHINFLHVCSIRYKFSEEKRLEKTAAILCNTLVNTESQRLCWAAGFFVHSQQIRVSLVSRLFASDSRSKAINSENHRSRRWRQQRGMEMHD